jgi:disulfide bond formation protein DsbB
MINSRNQILIILGLVNIAILLSAYFIQYILKIPPCAMCYYQRIPYYLATAVIFLALFKIVNFRTLFSILILLSFISISLGLYHVGIEQGFLSELNSCSNNIKVDDTANLLKELQKQSVVSCKDISFKIFGLSLAAINSITSVVLMLIYWLILKYEK